MTKTLSIMRTAAIALTLTLTLSQAHAQMAYTGDSGHYLTPPKGYQQTQQQPITQGGRAIFNGQGMGQGQAQMQPSSMQPAAPTTASSRLMPQGYETLAPLQTQPMQQQIAQPVQVMQRQPMPVAAPVVATGSMTTAGEQTNVQLRPSCDSDANHRAHKGLNTSTTVNNDCLN